MNGIRDVFLFRHGETDWNVQQRFQGHVDVPLNEQGRRQSIELAEYFRPHDLGVILSSDLARAFDTATLIAQRLGIPVIKDIRLREAFLGEAQGLTAQEITLKFGPELIHRWKSYRISDADISYPGGETGRQVLDRTRDAIKDFLVSQSFIKIGVATHGGVIRRMMQSLLPPGSTGVPIPNGIVYKIHYNVVKNEFYI